MVNRLKRRMSLALVLTLFLASPQAEANWFAECIRIFTVSADELARVPVETTRRLREFPPGMFVTAQSGKQSVSGWIANHSDQELVLIDESSKSHLFKSAKTALAASEPAGPNPLAQDLPLLARHHEIRIRSFEADPVEPWEKIQSSLAIELGTFRKLKKEAQIQYLRSESAKVLKKLQEMAGTDKIGFHYNLNGGYLHDYVNGGLRISKGDIQLNYGGGDPNYKVYFFRGDESGLFEVLNSTNPKLAIPQGRMGNVLVAFRYDSEYFQRAKRENGITSEGSVSYDFNESWTRGQPLSKATLSGVGVPSTEYAAPPALIFSAAKKRANAGSLSRNDETLVTLRYLEAFWSQHHF